MTPNVSVIVTCFNQEKTLTQAVISVLNQSFTNLECLIIDDGSTDDSRLVAQTLMEQDPRVKYYQKKNGGVSSCRNFGLSKAQGNWVQFLDGDDWLNPDKIQTQLDHFSQLKFSLDASVILYSDYQKIWVNESGEISQTEPQIVGEITAENLIKRVLVPDFLAGTPFPLLQQCLLIHRSIFNWKQFDETLKILEDREFVLDLLTQNIPFIYIPIIGSAYVKYSSPTTLTSNWKTVKLAYLSYYEIIEKKYPELLPYSQIGIQHFLNEAIREHQTLAFQRLYSLVRAPITLFEQKLTLPHPFFLKFVYRFRKIFLKLYRN